MSDSDPVGTVITVSRKSARTSMENTTRSKRQRQVNRRVEQLEEELRAVRAQLQETREEYETSVEELTTANEELKASREELQATNEELTAVSRERRIRTEKLDRANSDLQSLIASTDIGALFLDRALCVKRFTPRLADLFNVQSSNVGRPAAHLTHRLDYDELLDDAQQVLDDLVPIEREVQSKAGRWYLMRLHPYRTMQDQITGVVFTFVDITRRKQTTESLAETQHRLRAIFDNAPDGILLTDDHGRYVDVNPAACTLLGYDRDELLEKTVAEVTSVADAERFQALWQDFVQKGKQTGEYQLRHRDGTLIEVEYHAVAHVLPGLHVSIVRDITERKRAEEALRESKRFLQRVLDALYVFVGVCTPEGTLIEVNKAALAAAALQPDDVLHKPFEETYWWAYAPEVQARLREALDRAAAGEASRFDAVVRMGDDRFITIDFQIVPMFDEQGELTHLVPSAIDITERKQAEEALRESRQRLRSLFEASPDAIFVEDLEGNVLTVNPAACRLHGVERETLIGMNVVDLVPPDQREALGRDFENLISGEVRHLRAYSWMVNDHAVPVEIRANLFTYQGEPALLLHVRDITERIEAEKALEESQARAQAILEATTDAVVTFDVRGVIESANPAAHQMFGYVPDELIGHRVTEFIPCHYGEELDRYLQHYCETGQESRRERIIGVRHEGFAQRKDGSMLPVELAVSEAHLDGRRVFTVFIRDISQRRRLEREVLRISEQERQRIGQDIHDQLASQFGGIALLGRGLVNQWKRKASLNADILEEVVRLARSGAEQARVLAQGLNPVRLEQQGLAAALKDLVHHAQVLSGMSCSFEADEELPALGPEVVAQMYRIAQEAVHNTVRHAEAEHLWMRLRIEEDHLVLTVRDDGAGLPEDLTATDGMGLHIMPYRARTIGAVLRIHSAPKQGTTVTCMLPLGEVEPSQL